MTGRILPNLGLKAFYTTGESGWGDDMSLNMLKLSVITQGGIISMIDPLPTSPNAGDVYVVTTTGANQNSIAVYDNGAWVYFAPSAGWSLYDLATSAYVHFNGTTWASVTSTTSSAYRGTWSTSYIEQIDTYGAGAVPSNYSVASGSQTGIGICIDPDAALGTTNCISFISRDGSNTPGASLEDNANSSFQFNCTAYTGLQNLEIHYKVNSENGFDGMYVNVDGTNVLTDHTDRTGSSTFIVWKYNLAPGAHTITIGYSSDTRNDDGYQNVHISKIVYPTQGSLAPYVFNDIVLYNNVYWSCVIPNAITTPLANDPTSGWIQLGTDALSQLLDVNTTTVAPTNGQALIWNSTDGKWEPGSVASSSGGSSGGAGGSDFASVVFDGATGAIHNAVNVSSVTVLGAGRYLINFTTPASDPTLLLPSFSAKFGSYANNDGMTMILDRNSDQLGGAGLTANACSIVAFGTVGPVNVDTVYARFGLVGSGSSSGSSSMVIKPTIRAQGMGYYNTASVNVPFPAGTVVGDLVIIWCVHGFPFGNGAPTGWFLLDTSPASGDYTNGIVIARVMSAGDITTGYVTVTANGDYDADWCAVAIVGDTVASLRGHNATFSAGNASVTNEAMPYLAGAKATDLLLGFCGSRGPGALSISNFNALVPALSNTNASAFIGEFTGTIDALGISESATSVGSNAGMFTSLVAITGITVEGSGSSSGSFASGCIDNTQTITAGNNIASVTKLSAGIYQVNFTTPATNANYIVTGTAYYAPYSNSDTPIWALNSSNTYATGKTVDYFVVCLRDSVAGAFYDCNFDFIVTMPSAGSGATTLAALTDVEITSGHAPTDGQSLTWSAADNKWKPATTGGSGGLIKLGEVTLSSSSATIDFPNIPQGYRNLRIEGSVRFDLNSTRDDCTLIFNGDTGSNYGRNLDATVNGAQGDTSDNTRANVTTVWAPAANAGAGFFGTFDAVLFDYSQTDRFKGMTSNGQSTANIGDMYNSLTQGIWFSEAAITDLTFKSGSNSNFVAGSRIAIYAEALTSGSGSTTLAGLTDVNETTPPTNGQALVWNSTDSKWEPSTIASVTESFVWGIAGFGVPEWGGVTATATNGGGGDPNNAIGPTPVSNFYWNTNAGGSVVFDFGVAVVIDGIGVQQDTADAQGNWQAAGSNDNATWTNLGTPQPWGGVIHTSMLFPNTTAYRYYRTTSVDNATNNHPFVQWFLFRWAIVGSGSGGGGSTTLDDLTDVDVTTAPTDGQALVWSTSESKWKPGSVASSGGGSGGSAMELVQTINAANSADVVFTGLSSDYAYYILEIMSFIPNPSSDLTLFLSTDNGATFDTGANYDTATWLDGSGGYSVSSGGNAVSGVDLQIGTPADGTGAASCTLKLINPSDTTDYKAIQLHTLRQSADGNFYMSTGGARWRNAGAYNAVKIAAQSGDLIQSGKFLLYGVRGTPSSGGATTLAALTDVNETTPPANGQALVWNAADSKWEPSTISGGGALVLLSDQTYSLVTDITIAEFDHTKYLNYHIDYTELALTGGGLALKYSSDGGATFDGSNIYDWAYTIWGSGGYDTANHAASTSAICINQGSAPAPIGSEGRVTLYNMGSTTQYPRVLGEGITVDPSSNLYRSVSSGQWRSTAGANAVQLLSDNGSQVSGRIRVWGELIVPENGSGATTLAALTDIDETTPPTNGQALVWNATSGKWEPGTITGGGGGALTLLHVLTAVGGETVLSATGIPASYGDLMIVTNTNASDVQFLEMTFNGDTAADYDYAQYGNSFQPNQNYINVGYSFPAATSPVYFTTSEFRIVNYAKTDRWKIVTGQDGQQDSTSTTNMVDVNFAAKWRNTAAINQIDFTLSSAATYSAGSEIRIYGLANQTSGSGSSGGTVDIIDYTSTVSGSPSTSAGSAKATTVVVQSNCSIKGVLPLLIGAAAGTYVGYVATVDGSNNIVTVLATSSPVTIATSTGPDYLYLPFSSAVPLSAGSRYAFIVARTDAIGTYALPAGSATGIITYTSAPLINDGFSYFNSAIVNGLAAASEGSGFGSGYVIGCVTELTVSGGSTGSGGSGSTSLIQSFVAVGTESYVDFSVPNTFTDLQLSFLGNGSAASDVALYFNGDFTEANYEGANWNHYGSGAVAYAKFTSVSGDTARDQTGLVTIPAYNSARTKGYTGNNSYYTSSDLFGTIVAGAYMAAGNTAPITTIRVYIRTGTFSAGTTISLVGLGGAGSGSGGSGSTTLAALTDIDETTPPTDGQALTWDAATSKWHPSTIAASGGDVVGIQTALGLARAKIAATIPNNLSEGTNFDNIVDQGGLLGMGLTANTIQNSGSPAVGTIYTVPTGCVAVVIGGACENNIRDNNSFYAHRLYNLTQAITVGGFEGGSQNAANGWVVNASGVFSNGGGGNPNNYSYPIAGVAGDQLQCQAWTAGDSNYRIQDAEYYIAIVNAVTGLPLAITGSGSGSPSAAPVLIQRALGRGDATAALTVTFTNTPTVGNVMVLLVNGPGGTYPQVPAGWQLIQGTAFSNQFAYLEGAEFQSSWMAVKTVQAGDTGVAMAGVDSGSAQNVVLYEFDHTATIFQFQTAQFTSTSGSWEATANRLIPSGAFYGMILEHDSAGVFAITTGTPQFDYAFNDSSYNHGAFLIEVNPSGDQSFIGTETHTYNPDYSLISYFSVGAVGSSGPISLSILDDVNTTSTAPSNGQALVWNSTDSKWEPHTITAGSATLAGLTDVNETTPPTNGQALVWNATDSKWEPSTIAGSFKGEWGSATVWIEQVDSYEAGNVPSNYALVAGSTSTSIGICADPDAALGTAKCVSFMGTDGITIGGSLGDNANASFQFACNASSSENVLTLHYKINNENTYDGMFVNVDGVNVLTDKSDQTGSTVFRVWSYNLTPGAHEIVIGYTSDRNGDDGYQNVHLSQISYPLIQASPYVYGDTVTVTAAGKQSVWFCITPGTNAQPDNTNTASGWVEMFGDGSGSTTLAALTDVNETTPPTNGQALVWNSTDGKWEPGTTGLADAPSDGHTYARNNGAWVIVDKSYIAASFAPVVNVASLTVFRHAFVISVNFVANLTGSNFSATTAATASATYTIHQNGNAIGTLVWAIGGTVPTVTFTNPISFVAGDIMDVIGPVTPDTTLAGITLTFLGAKS